MFLPAPGPLVRGLNVKILPQRQMKKAGSPNSPRGITLMEILIAIVIFGGVVVVLGEVGRSSLRNAAFARDTTQAELICESLMGMLRVGMIPLETQTQMPLDENYPDTNAVNVNRSSEPLWYYSVEVYSTDEEGLLEVVITVYQNRPDEQRPVSCRMLRWMIDPDYLTEMETEMEEILNPETETSTETGTSTTTTSTRN